jgi:hypothetical protein
VTQPLTRPPSAVQQTASDQVFYPSLVCNFILQFDEYLLKEEFPNIPFPELQTGNPNTVTDPNAKSRKSPTISTTSKSNISRYLTRVPRAATIELPAYRTAGKFTLEIDWRELPIDPRLIRMAAVFIYVGSVGPTDFGAGMRSGKAGIDPTTNLRRSVLSTTANSMARDDLLVIHGIIDNWAITRGDSSCIKMEGRDLRGLFLDSPIDPNVASKVNLSRDIINVVADILRPHPASELMTIIWNPNDWTDSNGNVVSPPSVADPEQLTRVRRSASGTQSTGGSMNGDQTSFWDLVTQYCFLVGAVPFFRGTNLVIRPARSLFDQSKESGQAPVPDQTAQQRALAQHPGTTIGTTWDPVFDSTRYDDNGKAFGARKFIYGRNIKELSFERKYTGITKPVIKLVSYDTSSTNRGTSKLLTAEFPPNTQSMTSARTTSIYPSGKVAQTDVRTISVPGIRDQGKLNAMAMDLYQEIARGEMGGSCETAFLASFKGDNADPDILRLRPGHAVEFLFDTRALSSIAPAASTELDFERASFDDAVKEIKKVLGTDDTTAKVIVATTSRNASSAWSALASFRVANVNFTWSLANGIQVKFDFQNYFILRSDVMPRTGKNTASTKQTIGSVPTTQPLGQVYPTKLPRRPRH